MVVNNNADISFTARLNIAQMQKDLSRLGKVTRSKVAAINQEMAMLKAGFKVDTKGLSNKDFGDKQNLVKANMQKELADKVLNTNQALESQKKVLMDLQNPAVKAKQQLSLLKKETSALHGKDFTQKAQVFANGLDKSIPAIKRFRIGMSKVKKEMEGVRQEFPAWALSTMFFGMQMVGVFKSVWSSATKTFNDIMHSVEGTITAFDHLEGATTYLRFVAGQALEPIAMALLPIIDSVSDWIQGNQELFRTLMMIFGVGGVFLTGTGLAALNINAIVGAVTAMKKSFLATSGVLTKIFGTIGLIKGALIAIGIVALIAMWKTNFAGFKDFVTETFGGIVATIESVFSNVFPILKNAFAFIMNVLEGDWEAAGDNLVQIFLNITAIITKIVWGLGMVIANTIIFALNTVKSAFALLIDFQMNRLQELASMLDFVFKTKLADGVKSARNAVKELSNMTDISYISTDYIKKGLEQVDVMLGLKNNKELMSPAPMMSPDTGYGSMSYVDNKDVTINVYQQPGEDNMSLVDDINDGLMSRFTQ